MYYKLHTSFATADICGSDKIVYRTTSVKAPPRINSMTIISVFLSKNNST